MIMSNEATTISSGVPNGESSGSDHGGQSAATPVHEEAKPEDGQAKSSWPENWRDELAGDDKAMQNLLARYKTPADFAKSHKSATDTIRSGKVKPLRQDATAEELAKWREDNGIPAKPDGYGLDFDNGLVVGDADKPIIDEFLQVAHAQHMKPEHVKAAVGFWIERQGTAATERNEKNRQATAEAIHELTTEFGDDGLRDMINVRSEYFKGLPDDVVAALEHARMPDGRLVGSVPSVFKWVHGLASSEGMTAQLAPKGETAVSSIDDQIASITKDPAFFRHGEERNKLWNRLIDLQKQKSEKRGKDR